MKAILCIVGIQLFAIQLGNYKIIISANKSSKVKKTILREEFKTYSSKAQLYLDREVFKGTPITGEMLGLCAQIAFDSTGILVPLELALSQAQWESGMGRKGLSPDTNPYNVGEFDNGTVLKFNCTYDGVLAYYMLISKDYLKNKNVDSLLSNFTNHRGHRYASKPSYETDIQYTYNFIHRWLNNRKHLVN